MTKAVQRLITIHADGNGNPPDSIHLMSAGHWHTPWHGAFEMTPSDLADMVTNFNAGVGLVEDSKKAPINYGHDISGKAAGWITSLFLENNGTELWGNIEWTPNGKQMLADGEFRYISPEWNPRDLPWENPEVEGEIVDNVFTGAGLTNIPLFKKLRPVMASVVTGGGDNSNKGEHMLELEEVRVKKLEDLTDEEKAFLAEHKAELTDEERTAFGLVEAQEDAAEEEAESEADDKSDDESDESTEADEEEAEEPATLQASASKQGVTMTAEEVEQLRADAKAGREAKQELLKTNLTASVKTHVDRGALKSDQLDEAVSILMASNEATRERLSKFLASLPSNEIITAGEQGKGVKASTDIELTAEEKEYAADFNLTPEEVAEYKKSKQESKE